MTELIPDNFITSQKRLLSLKHKLDCNRTLKEQYSKILQEYEEEGIIERVTEVCQPGTSHYLPHRAVIKENRETSKIRIVFDGSSKQRDEPALNDLLYSGPCLLPLLYDILLRFRLGTIAITADIKQAFLQILVNKEHQNYLRFLWYDDIFKEEPNIIVYRFTRVIFGLISSPFLLNGTLKLHFTKLLFQEMYERFIIEKLLRDLYVDDLVSSFNSEHLAFTFYQGACEILAKGGFDLRKWVTNFNSLQKLINDNSSEHYSECDVKRVLGLDWDIKSDEFSFMFNDIIETAQSLSITKRNILKVASMFFDPLGLICPLVLQVKILFKEACSIKVNWDDELPTELIVKWKNFLKELKNLSALRFDRYLFSNQRNVTNFELHGFCDASLQAYSAVIYVRTVKNDVITTNLLTAKSKIVPNRKLSVPKLELMSCLLLSRLIVSVKKALSVDVNISDVVCWSDSKVALWWVRTVTKKWKVWVENRVSEIREKVGVDCWRYVPTDCNSADIATRYNKKLKFDEMLWCKGPSYLSEGEESWPVSELDGSFSEGLEVNDERRGVVVATTLSVFERSVCKIIDCERFSSLEKLLKVTCYVKRFLYEI